MILFFVLQHNLRSVGVLEAINGERGLGLGDLVWLYIARPALIIDSHLRVCAVVHKRQDLRLLRDSEH
jgi:hypothetical protein